jgi:PhnB protein
MQVQPYLFLDGRCEEALEFYGKALGAKVAMILRFKESPDQTMVRPGSENKIMHAAFRIGDTTLLASDGMCQGQAAFQGFALSISVANEAEAQQCFTALADGGEVRMPLAETFFSPSFGMVADRFGVTWMVLVAHGITSAPMD